MMDRLRHEDLRQAASNLGQALQICIVALVLVCVLLLSGCMQPANIPVAPDDETPDVFIPPTEEKADELSLTVAAGNSLLATIHEVLGDKGTLTLNPEAPIILKRPQATLTLKPGTAVTYRLGKDGGVLSFADPKPSISAKVWGLSVSPSLNQLTLKPDNTGTAHVQSGPLKLTRRFSLAWDTQTGTPQPQQQAASLPVIRMYTAAWCGPCQQAHRALDAAQSLPVRVEYINEPHPSWVTSIPYFEWTDSTGKRWGIEGWPGVSSLINRWQQTQRPRVPDRTSAYSGRARNQWTFPGSTRGELIEHLQHGLHAGKFKRSQLEGMTFGQLLQLHTDDHEANRASDIALHPATQRTYGLHYLSGPPQPL